MDTNRVIRQTLNDWTTLFKWICSYVVHEQYVIRRSCSWVLASEFKFIVALRPQRLYGLLGTGSPGRPPRLSHSSWTLTHQRRPSVQSRSQPTNQPTNQLIKARIFLTPLLLYPSFPPLTPPTNRQANSVNSPVSLSSQISACGEIQQVQKLLSPPVLWSGPSFLLIFVHSELALTGHFLYFAD